MQAASTFAPVMLKGGYDHPYQSPQLPLWEPGEVEWFVIIRADPRVASAPETRADAVDPVAFVGEGDGTHDG